MNAAGALLQWGRDSLTGKSETPERDAEVLMIATTVMSRASLYAFTERLVEPAGEDAFREAIERRVSGEPVAYIVGTCGFHAIELAVNADVLVPRPETEIIVDAVDGMTRENTAPAVLDAGTGSGALALAIKHVRPSAAVTGIDLSPAALRVARANGRRLGLDVRWLESDWFSAVAGQRFDIIVCNPPYVATTDPHMRDLRHEPVLALDGGDDGLDAIRAMLGSAAEHLERGGSLLLEHGHDQADAVAGIASGVGLVVRDRLSDLAGHERVAVIELAA